MRGAKHRNLELIVPASTEHACTVGDMVLAHRVFVHISCELLPSKLKSSGPLPSDLSPRLLRVHLQAGGAHGRENIFKPTSSE